jgi:hypothetical protein
VLHFAFRSALTTAARVCLFDGGGAHAREATPFHLHARRGFAHKEVGKFLNCTGEAEVTQILWVILGYAIKYGVLVKSVKRGFNFL